VGTLNLAVTIDVEEEGLFFGQYDPGPAPTHNVPKLALLDPIFCELDIRPTLFVTFQVARRQEHHDIILGLNEKWKGEIGAHLHTWNTPPIEPLPYPAPVTSELIPQDLLREKTNVLMESFKPMGVDPSSFRMGRFNMGPRMFSILENAGIRVDSSIAPARSEYGGPDHLAAPSDPYFPDPADPCTPGLSRILEVPLTILPLTPRLGHTLERMTRTHLFPRPFAWWFSKNLGSLTAQPMSVGLKRLKAAIRVHLRRGGKTVTVFFHSSELMPGACPEHGTAGHVDQFLEKLRRFLAWLRKDVGAESLTLSQLYHHFSYP
jgi:hypothetical protein